MSVSGFNFYTIKNSDFSQPVDFGWKLNKIPPFLKTINRKPVVLNLEANSFNGTVILNCASGQYACVVAIGSTIMNVCLYIDSEGSAVFKMVILDEL